MIVQSLQAPVALIASAAVHSRLISHQFLQRSLGQPNLVCASMADYTLEISALVCRFNPTPQRVGDLILNAELSSSCLVLPSSAIRCTRP